MPSVDMTLPLNDLQCQMARPFLQGWSTAQHLLPNKRLFMMSAVDRLLQVQITFPSMNPEMSLEVGIRARPHLQEMTRQQNPRHIPREELGKAEEGSQYAS